MNSAATSNPSRVQYSRHASSCVDRLRLRVCSFVLTRQYRTARIMSDRRVIARSRLVMVDAEVQSLRRWPDCWCRFTLGAGVPDLGELIQAVANLDQLGIRQPGAGWQQLAAPSQRQHGVPLSRHRAGTTPHPASIRAPRLGDAVCCLGRACSRILDHRPIGLGVDLSISLPGHIRRQSGTCGATPHARLAGAAIWTGPSCLLKPQGPLSRRRLTARGPRVLAGRGRSTDS